MKNKQAVALSKHQTEIQGITLIEQSTVYVTVWLVIVLVKCLTVPSQLMVVMFFMGTFKTLSKPLQCLLIATHLFRCRYTTYIIVGT